MGFLTFTPTSGDTDNVLLQKIVQILAAGGGTLTMGFLRVLPTSGDTDNVLLQKIVQILAGPTGSGGGIFIAAVGGSGSNITLAGTTLFSGCIGSNLSFCPDNTWGVGIAGARPKNVDVATSYKYQGIDVIVANIATDSYYFGRAGNLISMGLRNTAVGSGALLAITTGSLNVAVGYQALILNTTGINNTAVGGFSLAKNTTGDRNVAIGYLALNANTTGTRNVAIGPETLVLNTTGGSHVAVGYQALNVNTTGAGNTAIGQSVLSSNTTGIANTAIGSNALSHNATGGSNTVGGADSLRDNVGGSFNTAYGNQVLRDLNPAAGTGANTALGYNTGRGITTGINNTILGANVTGLAAALSNNIIIADGAGNQRITADATGAVTIPISLRLDGPLIIPAIANARAGNAVLVAGTVTVANTSVTANTVIMITRKTIGGVVGNTSYTTIAATSFTINSSNIADTSTMSYFLIENP